MASILGIKGFNRSGTSINVLLAAYGNDIVNVSTNTGYGLNLNGNNVEMEVFLDRVFVQNGNDRPISFDGTSFSHAYVGRCLVSKYIKKNKSKIYLGFCSFPSPQAPLDTSNNAITFPSRVFNSDFFKGNNLTWGIEWGRNGRTEAGSPFFNLSATDAPLIQDFVTSNIKIGDSLFITNGNTQLTSKEYKVKNIISPYRLEVTENFPVTTTALHFWVSGNWFDVGTDDNDSIMGFGENYNNLIILKRLSLWYQTPRELKQVENAFGTSSQRSVINHKRYTYYFHGSEPAITGIYRFDGASSVLISRGIDPYIRGISSALYDNVVGWREGDDLRWYLGATDNTNENIDLDRAVATLSTSLQAWSVDPIADVITCSTRYRKGNREDSYCGTDDDEVLQMGNGNTFNTAPITAILETKVYYPSGTSIINDIPRIQVLGKNTKGIKIKYKLWNAPELVDDNWIGLGELQEDKTELVLPQIHKISSGIQLRTEDMNSLENDGLVEKFTIFFKPIRKRLL